MGAYQHMKESFISEYKEHSEPYKARLVKWNDESVVVRIQKPTNIARAREIGYKAKQGVIVARVAVLGGKKKRVTPGGGRKPSKSGRYFTREKSTQAIAEERAAKKFTNAEVLNSYFVGEIGSKKFYEVILLDRSSPSIINDPIYSNIINQKNRVFRGLTHAGRKHRGIAKSGFGTKRHRPSKRANIRG
ncbi:MAG: 50S ribosomal protein L15e [Candidatus Micrarchaeia archaeon]